jgi:hypothetical protein
LEEFMRLSPEVERLLPGEEDVAFYEEHGYYVTPKALPDDVIDAAIRGAQRHWAGARDWRLPVSGGFGDWKPGDGDTIRNSEYTALQNREIRALVQHPIIGAIAGCLTRSSEIRLWDDQLVSKPPSAGPRGPVVGWHTDRAYWMTCTSEDMLTAWMQEALGATGRREDVGAIAAAIAKYEGTPNAERTPPSYSSYPFSRLPDTKDGLTCPTIGAASVVRMSSLDPSRP